VKWLVYIAMVCTLALGQISQETALSFDVASVKADDMSAVRMYRATCLGGPGTRSIDQFFCTDATDEIMVMAAFGIQRYQLSGARSDRGPRFEVRAVIPKGATREQIRVMFQNLLKERFHFAYHFEKREMSVFELVKVGNGPKLRPSPIDVLPPESSSASASAKKAPGLAPLSRGNFSAGAASPPGAKVLMPASIERSVWEYFSGKAEQRGVDLSELLTEVLKRDIEINEALK
jgi:uncharacterized protein (TIGR03435 family)